MNSSERLAPQLPAAMEPPQSSLRGRRYGEDRLYLLVRDPHTALAVWELTQAAHARAQATARERGSPVRYRMVIERRANERDPGAAEATHDLPDALGGDRWYVKLTRPGGECRALLGLAIDGVFEPLLQSSWVPVPPDGPCAEEGAWDLTPEAKAWLLERARAARGTPGAMGSAARYAAPDAKGTTPR